LEIYAQVFEQAGALDRLEAFASQHGARFYGLPLNNGTVTLAREPWEVPARLPLGADEVVPLAGGSSLRWRLIS
jgi:dihydroorotase